MQVEDTQFSCTCFEIFDMISEIKNILIKPLSCFYQDGQSK